ncbi:sensor domain-containing protein [Salimicrobium halophilum]|uniref:PAS domain S-box-containing protein/diguanylate cyclase (GGDEF) domain-containing protein n=1 Tax=Salimicrobium halophilum TaxID=86666 RepID=A0A1G8S6K2_9BACI|nr:bifunctional diguanylate cyclase/phosphodiesterase [Salimicrobium halophilum]SDJ24859.1 PAS domain S-box-containing protein/diguanylate cyclase (GGDEF) domain-containing protein [Salimicrobium halophilum]
MDKFTWTREDLIKIIHSTDNGIFLSDPEHDRFIDINSTVLSKLGYTKDEFMTILPSEFLGPFSAEKKEEIHYTKYGYELPAEVRSHPITLSDGHTYMLTVASDITKSKDIEYKFKRTNEEFQSLFLYHPDIIFTIDMNGIYKTINPAAEEVFGYTTEEITGTPYLDYLTPEAGKNTIPYFYKVMRGETVRFETIIVSRDNRHHIMDVTAVPLVLDDKITGVIGIARDRTDKRETEKRLHESEQRYRALFDYNIDAVMTFDTNGKFTHVNSRTEEITGAASEDLVGRSFLPFVVPEQREETMRQFTISLDGAPHQYETTIHSMMGERLDIHITLIPIYVDEEITGIHCIGKDITEWKRVQTRMNHLAYHDTLTGLPNQRHFTESIAEVLQEAEEHDEEFSIFFLDVDRFKFINDYLGHHMGDTLLQMMATRLEITLGHRGTLFRYGGDEFIILAHPSDEEKTKEIAEDLIKETAKTYDLKGFESVSTVSVGISMYPAHGTSTETLIRRADNAMYHAKNSGKNNYQFYSPKVQKPSASLKTESFLYKALKKEEFHLVYQPQVAGNEEEVIGIEALLRWNNEELGTVSPGEFIPIAEETGLIVPIGEWVLEEACRQNKAWQDQGFPPLTVSVNLSMRQFYHTNLVSTIAEILYKTGLSARWLELEITESMAIHADEAVAILKDLKDIGVKIAIDDFGTGYSSLSYLKKFSIDQLKIDQSFVRDINSDSDDNDIITTIISLGHNLGLEVIAEGVETKEQLEFLKKHGCHKYQGYYFGKPAEAEIISPMIRKQEIYE